MINLLPVKKRKEVIALYKSRRFVSFSLLFVFVIFVSIVLLSLFFVIFNIQKNSLIDFMAQKDGSEQAVEFDRLSQIIEDLNQKSFTVVKSENFKKPSQIIDNIFKTESSSINIISIDFNQESGLVMVEGVARNRVSLVSFVESLKTNELFDQVDSPISNLVRNENALFKVEITLKKVEQ